MSIAKLGETLRRYLTESTPAEVSSVLERQARQELAALDDAPPAWRGRPAGVACQYCARVGVQGSPCDGCGALVEPRRRRDDWPGGYGHGV